MSDTIVAVISDPHSGGSTALFPNDIMYFPVSKTNHTPTEEQKKMFEHFTKCAKQIAKARKGKRLDLVVDGDAIDGDHHSSLEIVTRQKNEQINIHIDLMSYFLGIVNFDRRTDSLHYVAGTEIHSSDAEHIIGEKLKAKQTPEGHYAWDELRLEINGKRVWFVHHGPSAGKGANQGNSLRNWLRDNFFEALGEGEEPPHFVITGHTHKPYWTTYIGRYKGTYHCCHGMICPSWQQKTRFGHKVAPLQQNKIGMQYFVITDDGIIGEPVEMLMV